MYFKLVLYIALTNFYFSLSVYFLENVMAFVASSNCASNKCVCTLHDDIATFKLLITTCTVLRILYVVGNWQILLHGAIRQRAIDLFRIRFNWKARKLNYYAKMKDSRMYFWKKF